MVRGQLLLIFLLAILSSCVGTVEDKNALKTKTAKTAVPTISFAGITYAQSVSDTKVDVYFNAGAGNPSDLRYLVYVNDSQIPLEVNGNKIIPSLARPGEYKITIENLKVNTYYSFSVGLRDSVTGVTSNNNKRYSAQTFMNTTANFNGILSAEPMAGSLGQTQMLLKWIPAKIKGGVLGAMPEDPVAYRIQYIESSLGSASDLLVEGNPNVVTYVLDTTDGTLVKNSTSPKLLKTLKKSINYTSSVVIPDLSAGKKYYFLVRAIHSAYVDYRLLSGYQYEGNLNIMEAATLEPTKPISWDESSVVASTVLDDLLLEKKNLNWDAASGPFHSYRIYVRNIGAANNLALSPDVDAIDTALNDGSGSFPAGQFGIIKNAGTPYVQLSGLTPYNYYNVIVATCLTSSCSTASNKISSPLVNFQIIPTIAPFFGLIKIEHPTSSSTLNKISLQFDAPVISSGFLTDIEVYCMPSVSADPVTSGLLLSHNVASGIAGVSNNCQKLKRTTAAPANFSTFSSIEIEAVDAAKPFLSAGMEISGLEYCFGVIPVIKNGATVIYRDLANMITKCSYIQKKMPSALEFKGSKKICSELNNNSLTVDWEKPTSGIYNGYSVFWKKNSGGPFLFSEALKATTIIDPAMPYTVVADQYYRQDITNANTVSFVIQGLEAGGRYQYGVLAHDKNGALFNYSEINTNINDCSVSLPTAKFEEWIDILAIGPKEDGRNAHGIKGYKTFLAEALNEYGQPVELEIDSDGSLTSNFTSQFGDITDSTFNGVFGQIDNNPSKGLRMYSNQGIIRIAWKDVSFAGGATYLNDYISATEKAKTKPNRQYGYHVYRSDDNQQTWVKLTGSIDNQTDDNMGLLHPSTYYEWKRTNDGLDGASTSTQAKFNENKYKAVVFTDYSVISSQPVNADQNVERARVYYYKVVPVVNGLEVKIGAGPAGSVVPQNIIKVVLPPPNMAFVSRLMANRQTCMELGRTPSKDVSTFYTCPYGGVGATTLEKPAVLNSSVFVYDVGNDFMIDRYELGCNFTRGSTQPENSELADALMDFAGNSGAGGKFEGCMFDQNDSKYRQTTTTTESTITMGTGLGINSVAPAIYNNNRQLRKGDCISSNVKSIKNGFWQYMIAYPGFYGEAVTTSVSFADFFNVYNDALGSETTYSGFAAQSEYAAVHFNTADNYTSAWYPSTLALQGRDGSALNNNRVLRKLRGQSACTVNLPTLTSTNNKFRPRWIPASSLGNLRYEGPDVLPAPINADFSIITQTMGEIKTLGADNYLYDSDNNKVPGVNTPANANRFTDNTPLGRVVSTNASKVPPLMGLDQKSAQEFCSTYKIELGFESGGSWTKIKNSNNKRLMRRTEGIIAAAWPKLFKEGGAYRTIDASGNYSKITPETNRPVIEPTPAAADKIPPLVDVIRLEQGYEVALPTTAAGTLARPVNQFNGACNTNERVNHPAIDFTDLVPGNLLKTNIFRTSTANSISYFLTGSSYMDNDSALPGPDDYDTNTQSCISRYGIQDAVGNVRELSGEKIFCNSDSVTNGAEIHFFNEGLTTVTDPHIPAGGALYRREFIVPKGFITDPALSSSIGSCSMVKNGSDRSGAAAADMFTDGSSIFNTVFNLWGAFTDLVASAFRNLEDPKSIEGFRSSDGFFLDFGENALGASLEHGNELALYNNPNLSNSSAFFNPVVGLALKCPDIVCGTPLTPPVSDNKKFSTKTLNTSGLSLDVANFPIGNSQFKSDGVMQVEDIDVWSFRQGATVYPDPDLDAYISVVDDGVTPVYGILQNYVFATDGDFEVAKSAWATDYTYPLRFHNFGGVNDVGAGRYGGGLFGDNINREHERQSGVRCAISLE